MDEADRALHQRACLTAVKLYLAGPDVFHPDAIGIGARKKALCTRYGLVGLYPCDGNSFSDPGATIFAGCIAKMRDADGGVFNLTPFRGPSADVGTVFELGFMLALGKPIFAYTNALDTLLERLRQIAGVTRDGAVWRDPTGMMAEDFGNADNLMLDEALAAQGRTIHRMMVSKAERFTDLAGFEACLNEARAFIG